jgi:hypothetical protein
MARRWIAATGALLLLFGYLVAKAPAIHFARRQSGWPSALRTGDLIFQDLECGERCALIRSVTHSRYAHVGILVEENGDLGVWEAFRPVGWTPLIEFVHRGIGEKLAVYRFKDTAVLPGLLAGVRAFKGRAYDGDYQWDDERIYCSELIAKAAPAGFFVPHPVGDLGSHEKRIFEMSRGRLTPKTEMVSPRDLIESSRLERIIDELH